MFRVEKCVYFVLFLALFAAAAAWSSQESSCAGAVSAELGATVRGAAWDGESRYRLDVPTPGVVTLEVGGVPAGARLGLMSSECESIPAGSGSTVLLETSPEHLAFAALRPGTYFVRLGAEDSFKLTTSFVEAEAREEEVALRRSASTGRALVTTFFVPELVTKDEEHEVDPDPFRAAPGRRTLLTWIDFASARAILLPDGGEWTALITSPSQAFTKDDEHEVDPDPLRIGPTVQDGRWVRFASTGDSEALVSSLADWISSGAAGEGVRLLAGGALSEAPMLRLDLAARCRDDVNDDHGDTFACATAIGLGTVAAELGNGWGDDEDVFRFRLDEMRSVTIEAPGASLGLYDRFGQRLAAEGGVVVRTLLPGTYFVRVGGGDVGAYELTLASASW